MRAQRRMFCATETAIRLFGGGGTVRANARPSTGLAQPAPSSNQARGIRSLPIGRPAAPLPARGAAG
eukprot:3036174-Lingulodinium_polyedra.AAC.1